MIWHIINSYRTVQSTNTINYSFTSTHISSWLKLNTDTYVMLNSSTLWMLVMVPFLKWTHNLTLYACGSKTFVWSYVCYWFTSHHDPLSELGLPKAPSLNRETAQFMNASNATQLYQCPSQSPLWIRLITSQPLLFHDYSPWNSTILIIN